MSNSVWGMLLIDVDIVTECMRIENVVNPPQTPVFRKSIAFFETFLFSAIPTTNPMRTAPKKFVTSVRTGNCVLTGIRLMAYRPQAPAAPPKATKKKFIFLSRF